MMKHKFLGGLLVAGLMLQVSAMGDGGSSSVGDGPADVAKYCRVQGGKTGHIEGQGGATALSTCQFGRALMPLFTLLRATDYLSPTLRPNRAADTFLANRLSPVDLRDWSAVKNFCLRSGGEILRYLMNDKPIALCRFPDNNSIEAYTLAAGPDDANYHEFTAMLRRLRGRFLHPELLGHLDGTAGEALAAQLSAAGAETIMGGFRVPKITCFGHETSARCELEMGNLQLTLLRLGAQAETMSPLINALAGTPGSEPVTVFDLVCRREFAEPTMPWKCSATRQDLSELP